MNPGARHTAPLVDERRTRAALFEWLWKILGIPGILLSGVYLFLYSQPLFTHQRFVDPPRLLLGAALLFFALAMACYALNGIAMYQHPEWLQDEVAQRLRAIRMTPREHAFGLIWLGLSLAAELLVLALVWMIFGASLEAVENLVLIPTLIGATPIVILGIRALRRPR